MLKLAGAMCVIFAGTMLGFYQALQLSTRTRQIRQVMQGLQRLETEITYSFTPLSQALRQVADSLAGPVAHLFRRSAEALEEKETATVQEGWRLAVEECWSRTAMKRPERDAVLQLGAVLGKSDRSDQAKHLRMTVSLLTAEEAEAAEENRRYGKMWRSLGLLAGVLIVILMY